MSKINDLVMTTALVPLDINDDRIAETEFTAHQQREHGLQRIKRATMATNKHSKIRCRHVEDELTVIALILIDRSTFSIKVRQDLTKDGDGNISDGVKLLIGEVLTILIALGNLGISTYILRLLLLSNISLTFFIELIKQFLSHSNSLEII